MEDKEIKYLLEKLKCSNKEELIDKLVSTNSLLWDEVYDLQWFLDDHDFTKEDFIEWREQKELRIYH